MNTVVNLSAGTSIAEAARRLVNAATADKDASTRFNGILLTATTQSRPEDVVSDYYARSEAAAKQWRRSPAGVVAAQQKTVRLAEAQEEHDRLLAALPTIEWDAPARILDWLYEFQPVSDHVGVRRQNAHVIAVFTEHGYRADENVGTAFDEDNAENYARYIIGQCLSCLEGEVGAIHGVACSFIERWRIRFLG